ncbi:galactose oxidase [Pholiota conissans]|uniref:Galactose oxidase n=1 Tax=Pholiota conissans TaxID=109636 RepID=A0A9P6CUP9_9AGAR|nr:galactose oxidase [Pholiota conissans]
MKELKVSIGISEDHMTEVLHASLKNDVNPETFALKHVNSAGVVFPTQYIKIVPIAAHGQNFHISIWHVSLTGITDLNYVEKVRQNYDEFREASVLRYVLKHLRQRRLLTPYQSILSRANIRLEHPLITEFHESLVLQGDWSKSEKLLDSMTAAGLFDKHVMSMSQPQAVWTQLNGTDHDGDTPPARGGHGMCIDAENDMIYLLGGWNGEKSLDDFWVYSIKEDRWTVLSHSTTDEDNAPGPRSCHKMVFDTKTGAIYVLGRLADDDGLRLPDIAVSRAPPTPGGSRQSSAQQDASASAGAEIDGASSSTPKSLTSEFYRYHTRGELEGKWDCLSTDAASSGGPPLIFDHQMVVDSEAQMIYVFGGRVNDGDWNTTRFSGLYSYNIATSKWKTLQQPLADPLHGSQVIPSRFGHSMVFDPPSKTLYIFAGQRDDKFLSDMYSYNLNTGVATEIFSNFSLTGGPEACFTQRAVIDSELQEIYMFGGLTQIPTRMTRGSSQSNIQKQSMLSASLTTWMYRYGTRPGEWMRILQDPRKSPGETPQSRYAHQIVYNPKTKSVFLHGGNAGAEVAAAAEERVDRAVDGEDIDVVDVEEGAAKKRLDDFWKMDLKRPGPEHIIRHAKFQIRRQQFREMCEEDAPVKALSFLQTQVSSVVDHTNPKETEAFRSLLTHLLSPPTRPASSASIANSSQAKREDSRESSTRPRKRSRASSSDGSWEWASHRASSDRSSSPSPSRYADGGDTRHLRDMVDPLEAAIGGNKADGASLSGARYGQRTEVFENILKFISDDEKQPTQSLLDLVERDRC